MNDDKPPCAKCYYEEPYDQHDPKTRMCCHGVPRHEAGFARRYICFGLNWKAKQ